MTTGPLRVSTQFLLGSSYSPLVGLCPQIQWFPKPLEQQHKPAGNAESQARAQTC